MNLNESHNKKVQYSISISKYSKIGMFLGCLMIVNKKHRQTHTCTPRLKTVHSHAPVAEWNSEPAYSKRINC